MCYSSLYRRLSRNFSIAQTRSSARAENQGTSVTEILLSRRQVDDSVPRNEGRELHTHSRKHSAFFTPSMLVDFSLVYRWRKRCLIFAARSFVFFYCMFFLRPSG